MIAEIVENYVLLGWLLALLGVFGAMLHRSAAQVSLCIALHLLGLALLFFTALSGAQEVELSSWAYFSAFCALEFSFGLAVVARHFRHAGQGESVEELRQ